MVLSTTGGLTFRKRSTISQTIERKEERGERGERGKKGGGKGAHVAVLGGLEGRLLGRQNRLQRGVTLVCGIGEWFAQAQAYVCVCVCEGW
jgi:hypothetical protein